MHDSLQHHKTLLIVCLLLEESSYCFYLVYIPLSGNIRFFCIANGALKHCWESHNKPHYSVRCHPAYKVMLWTYSSIVLLFLILGIIAYYAVSFAFSFFSCATCYVFKERPIFSLISYVSLMLPECLIYVYSGLVWEYKSKATMYTNQKHQTLIGPFIYIS